ncbi:hypothetical protein CAL26_13530 [Bordetella genomosp. 9]|uniref:PIG-L family deacetylase n=1 Tax=Bordetella genomosp. 9 TaxID=1416803 RepID=A0A261R270_9BORD|nr:PIG-L family deacetylase [Bordetella genomosp. 9]OZI18720.1 hypothetical protein CAL26_13530 [Bordetella genomosp. 9]
MDALSDRLIHGAGTPEAQWRDWLDRRSLRQGRAADLVRSGGTLHIVAPHPDDEILGCGGIMREAYLDGVQLCIWAITHGEHSHPGSALWDPPALAQERLRESMRALALIAPGTPRHPLGIPDGGVTDFEDDIAARIARSVGPRDTVIAPWRWDGHPDHEAASRAALRAAKSRGGRFLEAPIWAWHWMAPETGAFPTDQALAVRVSADAMVLRRRAVMCFRSQLQADPSTGKPPVLTAAMLERLERPYEVLIE